MPDEDDGDALDPFEGDLVDCDPLRPRCRFCGQPLYGVAALEEGVCERCARIGAALAHRERRMP